MMRLNVINLLKWILVFPIICSAGVQLHAQESVFGIWKTIDDSTNEPKSIVEIYEENGKAYGKIIRLFRGPDEEQNPMCTECTDHRKDQPIIGMQIINDLEPDDDEWTSGEIMDPENGKIYRCKIWREGDELKVRGYIAFLFRTQTWLLAEK